MSAFQYTPSAAEQAESARLKALWDAAIAAADAAGLQFQAVDAFMNSAAMGNYGYSDRVNAMDAFGNNNAWFKDWRNFISPIPKTGSGLNANIDRAAYIVYFSNKNIAKNAAVAVAKKAFEDYQATLDAKANAYIQAATPAIQAQAKVAAAESNQKLVMYAVIALVIVIVGFIAYKKLK